MLLRYENSFFGSLHDLMHNNHILSLTIQYNSMGAMQ